MLLLRVLSWQTDDSFHDINIEKQPGEEMMVKVHFAELTQLSAEQPSSNPFDLIPTENQLVYPLRKGLFYYNTEFL